MENLDLLRFFFHADSAVSNNSTSASSPSHSGSSFLVFSLLVGFLHRDGHVGQQARDALINVMAMSRKNEHVGNYIAKHSNFCPVSYFIFLILDFPLIFLTATGNPQFK